MRLAGIGPAALVGGLLLNQNLVFIDTINDLVYREASLPQGSQGTATLFLEDVRVSTNVRLFENRRALGTRVSAAVRKRVLEDGMTWLDSAFVVNDWYISAYEPIVDSHGQRVGMLYVGFLEAPFMEAKVATLATLIAGFLVVTAASVPIFLRWARSVFKPLEQMTETIARVEQGEWTLEDNPLVHAPHTQADLMDAEWTRSYSREIGAFPSEHVKAAKQWPAVNRVDNVHGDRQLICSCPSIDLYRD